MTKNCPDCNKLLTISQNLYLQDSPYLYPTTIWKCLICKIEVIELLGKGVSPQPIKSGLKWMLNPQSAKVVAEIEKVEYKEYHILKTINQKFISLEKQDSDNQG